MDQRLNTKLEHILYIEDEQDIQAIASMALRLIGGFQVSLASSGPQGIAQAEQNPPQLILLDVMMPDQDGPATLAQLQQIDSLSQIPVIFLTAKVQSAEISHYQSLGAVDVIAKPFDPMKLPEQILRIWNSL